MNWCRNYLPVLSMIQKVTYCLSRFRIATLVIYQAGFIYIDEAGNKALLQFVVLKRFVLQHGLFYRADEPKLGNLLRNIKRLGSYKRMNRA